MLWTAIFMILCFTYPYITLSTAINQTVEESPYVEGYRILDNQSVLNMFKELVGISEHLKKLHPEVPRKVQHTQNKKTM